MNFTLANAGSFNAEKGRGDTGSPFGFGAVAFGAYVKFTLMGVGRLLRRHGTIASLSEAKRELIKDE